MKKIWMLGIALCTVAALHAQPPNVPAEAGASFGEKTTADNTINADRLLLILSNKTEKRYEMKLKAVVTEVCKAEGCWLRVKASDGQEILVKMKDHKFLVPVALNGKTVVIDGVAEQKTLTIEQQRHYAEDAKKSKEEIEAIVEPKKEVTIQAKGILVL